MVSCFYSKQLQPFLMRYWDELTCGVSELKQGRDASWERVEFSIATNMQTFLKRTFIYLLQNAFSAESGARVSSSSRRCQFVCQRYQDPVCQNTFHSQELWLMTRSHEVLVEMRENWRKTHHLQVRETQWRRKVAALRFRITWPTWQERQGTFSKLVDWQEQQCLIKITF